MNLYVTVFDLVCYEAHLPVTYFQFHGTKFHLVLVLFNNNNNSTDDF